MTPVLVLPTTRRYVSPLFKHSFTSAIASPRDFVSIHVTPLAVIGFILEVPCILPWKRPLSAPCVLLWQQPSSCSGCSGEWQFCAPLRNRSSMSAIASEQRAFASGVGWPSASVAANECIAS